MTLVYKLVLALSHSFFPLDWNKKENESFKGQIGKGRKKSRQLKRSKYQKVIAPIISKPQEPGYAKNEV